MKIVLTTDNIFMASRLKEKILKAVKGDINQSKIDTWSYIKAADNIDVIFHNPSQFTDDPIKNVVFRVELNGENVIFVAAYWTKNPVPQNEMFCLHVGRLTEMLLAHFSGGFSKFSIIEK